MQIFMRCESAAGRRSPGKRGLLPMCGPCGWPLLPLSNHNACSPQDIIQTLLILPPKISVKHEVTLGERAWGVGGRGAARAGYGVWRVS